MFIHTSTQFFFVENEADIKSMTPTFSNIVGNNNL